MLFSFTSWLKQMKENLHGARRKKSGPAPIRYLRPGLERLEARLAPATYLVNVLTDTAPGSGGAGSGTTGDLRYCITQADSAGDTDTILFAPGLSGTITVQSQALPALSANISLDGRGGSAVTVNGNSLGSVFSIGGGVTASVSGLTITGGTGSGGIFDLATQLTVSDCTITINSGTYGGGIENVNSGTLTVSNCTLSDNSASTSTGSGGIYNNAGTVTISGSTLSTNSASGASGEGGAIANNAGTVTVNTSTFAGNYATYGGAIFNSGATGSVLTVNNSTFYGNSAGVWGGAIYNQSKTAVSNSTFSGNSVSGSAGGGGIANFGTATLQNTLVAGNSATNGATGPDFYGSVSASVVINGATYTEGYNLIGVGAGSSGVTNGVNGDQVGTAASPINPELGPLQDNGGPSQTMALADNSPAINAGVTAFATLFDQRGVARPIGTPSDVGAYQLLTLGTNALTEGAAAGTDTDVVTFTGAWTAASNASWLHISSGGTGNGLATFTFDANSGATRTGTLTIALEVVTVTQAGSTYVAANSVTTLVSSGLSFPTGVAVDGAGNIYIADQSNNAIKEWNATTQTVTTLVSTGLQFPSGVAVDGAGNVYIADGGNNAIKEWHAATQTVTTLVGSGLTQPYSLAVDGAGNVYFADFGTNLIEEWNAATQMVTTLVSSGLKDPYGVAVDGSGNVYFADSGNNAIKEWNAATHTVTTLVSTGLQFPSGVAVDGSGNIIIDDLSNNAIKEWHAASQTVTTLVSSGLSSPYGVAVDGAGNVYIADEGNNAVKELPRAFVPSGAVSEPVTAGSDALLPVLPTSELLAAPFAPKSNQSWLTVGTVSSGTVHFSFTKNTGVARTAQLTVLGQQINVTQPSGQTTPTFSNLYPPSITYGTATQTISGQLNGNGGGSIPQGETVVVTLNGVPQNAMLTSTDTFSTPFNTSMLSVSSSPYTISFSYAGDANFPSASTTSNLTVNPEALTITATNQNQVYGFGGTSAALGTTGFRASSGTIYNGDITGVTITADLADNYKSTSGYYEASTWDLTASAATGPGVANYSITYANNIAFASAVIKIAPKPLTITGMEASDKPYDGTTTDPILNDRDVLATVIAGDVVNLNTSTTATFSQANPGNFLTVTGSLFSISGKDADNYSLSQPTSSASIEPATLTITASNQSLPYGVALDSTAFKVSGLVSPDSISGVALATNDSKNPSGNYYQVTSSAATITPSAAVFSLGNSSNYSITYVRGSLVVNPALLTITGISGTNKTYDGTTNDPLTGTASLSGLISGDSSYVMLGGTGVGTLASASVGPEAVTVTGYSISGADAGDYTFSQPKVGSVTVSPQTPPPGGGLLHLSDNGQNGVDLTVPILAAGDIVRVFLYGDPTTGNETLLVFTTYFDQIDYFNQDTGPSYPTIQSISVSDATDLNVYLANDSASPDTLSLFASLSTLTVNIGANPNADGTPPPTTKTPVTDTADTVILQNVIIPGNLTVNAGTIDFVGGGGVPYQGAVSIQSGGNGEYILTPTTAVDWQALGFATGDTLTLAGLLAYYSLGNTSTPFGLGTGVVDKVDGDSLYVKGIEPFTGDAPTNSTIVVPSGIFNLTVSIQGAQVNAHDVTLTSVNSLTLQPTGVPYLGNVTIHAAPLTGQPYAGSQYITGPDWGAYGYQPGDFITLSGPSALGSSNLLHSYTVEAIAGDNLYLAGYLLNGTNTYVALTFLPTGNFSDVTVASANFTPQITTLSGSGSLSLNVSGQGNSISGAIASSILAAQTNNGNITLFDTGSPNVPNNVVLLGTVNAGTANIQLDALGSIASDYLATPAANVAKGFFNLEAAAVDLRTTGTNSSIGAAPPGTEFDANGNPVPAAEQVLATNVGKLTATTNDGSVNIYNAGSPGSAASPLTIDSVVADTGGQAPTANDDQIVYNLTPELTTPTYSNAVITDATVSFSASQGGISSVTSTPTDGGSGYPASATLDLMVTGGGGSGGVVHATTDSTGHITSFDPTPVQVGVNYSTTTSGASTSFAPPSNVVITSTGPIILNSISATGPVAVQGTYIVKGNGQSQGMVTPDVNLEATGTAEYQGAVTFADAGASTTIGGGSDGVSLPQSTIHVVSTAGFPTSGMLSITIGVNIVSVTYNGLGTDGTSFLNCLGGGGKLAAGDVVAGTSPNTTIASGSDGASLTQSTPITIDVASTAGFASKGTILVTTSGGNTVEVNYTGTTGGVGIQASFTGCTGSGTLAFGDSVVTGDTLTLPAGQNWTSYGFSDGTAMAGASIVVSGAAVTANDSTFTVASVSGRTLTLQQSYVVDPETEPVVTVADGMIGLAGNAGNPTSNGIDLSEVGSFIAQTANGNIYLALGGTIDSRATSVIAGGTGNVSLTSAANFLTIENITANGATPSGASNVVGGNVGVDMNSGSLLEYPPNGKFTGTVTINNEANDGSATGLDASLTGTDWAAAGFAPGDVITISAPNVSSSTDYTIASISGDSLYLNAQYLTDYPGVSNATVATVSGLSSQIRGQNVYLTSALSIGTPAAPLVTNAASGLSVNETATSPSEAAVYVNNAFNLAAVAVVTYDGSVAINYPGNSQLSFSNTVLSASGGAVVAFTNSDKNDGSNDNVQVKGTIHASAISSASGQILAYDSSAKIKGQLLMLTAGNGIGIPGTGPATAIATDVTALDATTTTGGIYIKGDTTVRQYQGQVTFAQNAHGDTMTATGPTAWSAFAPGDTIVVSGAQGSANDADFIIASISGGTLTLAESDVVTPETDPSVTVQDALPVTASTSNGNIVIDLSSQGSMILEGISTKPNGTVTLDADGAIYNVNSVNAQSATVTTGTLILTANQVGTSSNPLVTSINFLQASPLNGGSLGALYLHNNTALTVSSATVAGNVSLSTIGNLALNAPVSLGTRNSGVTVTVTAQAGALTTTGNVSLSAGVLTIAAESIGSPTDVVQTNANSINATADYGGMYISNGSTAPLTLTAVSVGAQPNGVATNNIEIYSAGNILIDPQANSTVGTKPVGIFNPGGTLTLEAGETLSADGKTPTPFNPSTITSDVSSYLGQVTIARNSGGDTMTLPASGPTWTSLGFAPGDTISVSGALAAANNGEFIIASISGDTLTLTASNVVQSENNDTNVLVNIVISYQGQVTFAQNPGGDTMTLPASGPTWTSLGFAPGDTISVSGALAAANNSNFTIASISGDTLTLTTSDVVQSENNDTNVLVNGSYYDIETSTLIDRTPGNTSVVSSSLQLDFNHVEVPVSVPQGRVTNSAPLELTLYTLQTAIANDTLHTPLTYSGSSIIIADLGTSLASPLQIPDSLDLETAGGAIIFINPNNAIEVTGSTNGVLNTITMNAGTTTSLGGVVSPNSGATSTTAVAALCNLSTSGGNITVNAVGNITIGTVNAGNVGLIPITSISGSVLNSNGTAFQMTGSIKVQSAPQPASPTQSTALAQLNATEAIANAAAANAEAAADQTTANALQSELTSINTAVTNDQQTYDSDAQANTTASNIQQADQDTVNYDTQVANGLALASAIASEVSAGFSLTADYLGLVASEEQEIPVFGPALSGQTQAVADFVSIVGDFVNLLGSTAGLASASEQYTLYKDSQTLATDSAAASAAQSTLDQATAQLNADMDTRTAFMAAYNVAQQAATSEALVAREEEVTSAQAIAAVAATATPPAVNVTGPYSQTDQQVQAGASNSGITVTSPITVTPSTGSGAEVSFTVGTGGAIASVSATPTAPGSGYPVSSSFDLEVTGGGGVGGVVQATTDSSGFVTSFAVVAAGSGYSTTAAATTGLAGVTITSHSPLALTASITAPGPVNLTAATQAPPETGDDLTVNSGVTIQSTGTYVSFLAGDNVVIPAGATVDAGATITITGDANDNPSGALVTVYGTLNATSALIDVDPNSTGPDTFNIIPSANTPITVTGGQGMDTLNFNAEGLAVTLSGNTITAAGMQPVTFTNIAVVHITNAAHGGARFALAGTSGQANALSLVGTEQGAGTVTLNGVALSFSGVASFSYQGGSGDAISVTPFATALIPWNLAVAIAGGSGSPASLTYNSVASLADTVTATGADAGTIGSPGLAAVQFSNVGTITTDASQSPGDELTVNLRGTAPGAIVQPAGLNSAAIGFQGLFNLDLTEYASVTINASDTTGNGLFEVAEAAVLGTGLNIHMVGNPVYNDYLFVMGAAGKPAAIISKSAIAGNGSVTVGTPNTVTYQNIGTVKYLPVNSAAMVIQQPTNQTVLVNTVATFTALATANPAATVQWEESTNKGKTFQAIAGATSLSYSFTPQASDNGDQFKAVFTSSVGKPAVTTPAKLTVSVPAAQHVNSLPVKSAPKVTQQPVSKTVAAGTPVTFTVAASGTPAPTVQWMVSAGKGKPFTAIAGATALSYSLTALAGNSGELFEAVFTNALGKATTSAATLTVDVPPGVQANPSDQTAVKGKATFSVELTGTKPTVQWQVSSDGGKTWSNVKGVTAATLTLKSLTSLQDQWEYRVLVTNALGTFTSGAATLSV